MIKFFRKIRQRLLTENKFSKYLIYAIGEIILVVVGILIALSVNNWNEKRKSVNKGKEYFRLVYNDLKTDIFILNGIIKRLDEQSIAAENILNIIESQNHFIRDTLAFTNDWSESSWPLTVDRAQNTFSELKKSGQSTLIDDKSLIDHLDQFYNDYDSRIQNFNEYPKSVRLEKRIINMTSGNLSDFKTSLSKNINTRNYIQDVLGNPQIHGLLIGIYKSSHFNRIFFNELLVKAENIVKLIEERHPDKIF
ncbi:MAG: DUF6090 family protein [Maribacter sp.]|nr:DUF6090 family protein [Maribacter sp.]